MHNLNFIEFSWFLFICEKSIMSSFLIQIRFYEFELWTTGADLYQSPKKASKLVISFAEET